LADLNGDGRADLLSGSWPGEIYLFTRGEDDAWDEPQTLKTKDGGKLNVGKASAIAPIDWDRDGDVDLVIGEIRGGLFLVPNEGSPKDPIFGEAKTLQAGDGPATVVNDAGPAFADFDGDGVADLICGDGQGGVWWFRATRTDDGYELAAREMLIEGWSRQEQMKLYENPSADSKGEKLTRPSMRAKVAVADWNGDGLPDLLVGDYAGTWGPEPKLTENQIEQRDRLQAEIDELQPRMTAMYQTTRQRLLEKLEIDDLGELTEEQQADFNRQWQETVAADEEFTKLNERTSELWRAMREFQRQRFSHGWVWVYLRIPPETIGKRGAEMPLDEVAKAVDVATPSESRPVSVGAAMSADQVRPGDVVTVMVRARLAHGWHVYTNVPADQPFIEARANLDLPDGLEPIGDWQSTKGRPDRVKPALQVADGELVMTRRVQVAGDIDAGSHAITCRFGFQACNERICLPPAEASIELVIDVIAAADA
jgi:hypothetical protein